MREEETYFSEGDPSVIRVCKYISLARLTFLLRARHSPPDKYLYCSVAGLFLGEGDTASVL